MRVSVNFQVSLEDKTLMDVKLTSINLFSVLHIIVHCVCVLHRCWVAPNHIMIRVFFTSYTLCIDTL